MKVHNNQTETQPEASTGHHTIVDARMIGTFPTESLPAFKNFWDGFHHMAGTIAIQGQLTTEFTTTSTGEPLSDLERQLLDDMLAQQEEQQARQDKFGLTEREQEVLMQAARGKSNKQIATELFLSPNTVKSHMDRIGKKLGTKDRTGMVSLYYGLVEKVELDTRL